MDDGKFLLGQRKGDGFLLGGVQGGVTERRRLCGRGNTVRLGPRTPPARPPCGRRGWKEARTSLLGLPGHQPVNTEPTCFVSRSFLPEQEAAGCGPRAPTSLLPAFGRPVSPEPSHARSLTRGLRPPPSISLVCRVLRERALGVQLCPQHPPQGTRPLSEHSSRAQRPGRGRPD